MDCHFDQREKSYLVAKDKISRQLLFAVLYYTLPMALCYIYIHYIHVDYAGDKITSGTAI